MDQLLVLSSLPVTVPGGSYREPWAVQSTTPLALRAGGNEAVPWSGPS